MHSAGAALATVTLPIDSVVHAAGASQLPTRGIPSSGEPLSIVGLGNSQAFRDGDLQRSRQLLEMFMDMGGGYIDTSGAGDSPVGRIMREKNAQDSLFLGSYVLSTDDAEARSEIAVARAAQGGGILDLVHSRHAADMASNGVKYLAWKDEGLCRHLGVARSHEKYYEVMMKLIAEGTVDFIQINYSLFEPEAEQEVIPIAMDKGVAVIINRPFMNGRYFSLVKGRKLPEWAAEFDCHSWAQFSLKFILAHPGVNCVLTETANPEHLADNLGGGLGRLPDEKTRQKMRALVQDFG